MPEANFPAGQDIERGIKRLALPVLIGGALLLFYLADNCIFERRKHLLTIEILVYILIANFSSIALLYLGNRVYRWLARGFTECEGDARSVTRRPD
jgi:hypothetical protein